VITGSLIKASTVREVDLSNRDTITALKKHVYELEDFREEGKVQGFSSTAQFLTSLIGVVRPNFLVIVSKNSIEEESAADFRVDMYG
jgi:hypothetical protein